MYHNLDAEMARRKITRAMLAEKIGKTATTLSLKLNGKAPLTLSECIEIKNAVKIPQEVNQHKLIIHLRLLTNVARILPPLQVVR